MSSLMLAQRNAPDAACPFLSGLIDVDAAPSASFDGVFGAGAGLTTSLSGMIADLQTAPVGTLADITVEGRPSVSKLVGKLRRWGVALAPGLLPLDLTRALEDEFAAMMSGRASLTFRVDDEPGSTCVRVDTKRLDADAYPTISKFFASPVMRTIADAYFDGAAYDFNHTIFVHKTEKNDAPPSGELHFDVTRMLKFWVNLSDGTVANGAMRCVPGSHLWLRLLRRDYAERRTPKTDIPNCVDGAEADAVHLVGPAGTLFIFDTDMAHGASPVAEGCQRRIMRAHCTEADVLARARARG